MPEVVYVSALVAGAKVIALTTGTETPMRVTPTSAPALKPLTPTPTDAVRSTEKAGVAVRLIELWLLLYELDVLNARSGQPSPVSDMVRGTTPTITVCSTSANV